MVDVVDRPLLVLNVGRIRGLDFPKGPKLPPGLQIDRRLDLLSFLVFPGVWGTHLDPTTNVSYMHLIEFVLGRHLEVMILVLDGLHDPAESRIPGHEGGTRFSAPQ